MWMYLPSVSVNNCLLQLIYPLYSEGNDIKWNEQGFPPQIQRAGLTTVYRIPPNLTLKTLNKTSPSSEEGWQGYHRICTLHFYGWLDAFTFDDGDGSREGCYKIVFPNNRFVCLFACLFVLTQDPFVSRVLLKKCFVTL